VMQYCLSFHNPPRAYTRAFSSPGLRQATKKSLSIALDPRPVVPHPPARTPGGGCPRTVTFPPAAAALNPSSEPQALSGRLRRPPGGPTSTRSAPSGVAVEAQVYVVLQRYTEAVHEGRAGSDGVAVPGLRLVLLGNLRVGRGFEGVAVTSGFRGCLWKWQNGPPHSKGVAVATPQIRQHERHDVMMGIE
jgi:hypothetical protein